MATQQRIDVYFHNHWGSDIYDVKLRFSSSPSGERGENYSRACVAAGAKWGPLPRTYETGPHADAMDFWQVEFVSPGPPGGHFQGRSQFACVIDSEVPASRPIDIWVSGGDQAFYTGYPDGSGMRPGVSGYSGKPRNSPGGDYTCYSKLNHTPREVPRRDCGDA